MSATWIIRTPPGPGLRIAVKDLIDVAGMPTTAGSGALADAAPAAADAACVAALREAVSAGRASLAGKANLHELALGVTGVNHWFGTPVNPVDPRRVPGGSSSGSAVAVASGEADVAIGTDTGGSVRIPAACCGVAGLKTTWGRLPTTGVRPLAPSLDTVGPLARDIDGLVLAMSLLEPGFSETNAVSGVTVGRLRIAADPAIDAAVDEALARAGLTVVDVEVEGWAVAARATMVLLGAEAWDVDGDLVPSGKVGADVAERLVAGGRVTRGERHAAADAGTAWRQELERLWRRIDVLALPTLVGFPPLLEDAGEMLRIRATLPVNLAGVPALSLPVPCQPMPASLQLVGPAMAEELLLGVGRQVEVAIAP